MKKYLLSALALPLLFACSSEDYMDQKATDNDQFAGIEKVDATFSMANDPSMRMESDWKLEEGDQYGFAWLGDGTKIDPSATGEAYQNHPLTQTGDIFKPQTSIYVGKYYLYRPYDKSVVDISPINFSVAKQTIADGQGGDAWKALAKNAIIIGDKWTDVTTTGTDVDGDGKMWNIAGIGHDFKIYAAVFSNQTGLDLTYEKNDEVFDGKKIKGATDIDYTYPSNSTIGAADIYSIEVTNPGASKSFTYAPTSEPNGGTHSGAFWADKKALGTPDGFTTTAGAITLNSPDANEDGVLDGISTKKANNKGWFWFNSLPSISGTETATSSVKAVLETSYGEVTVQEELQNCAYAFEDPTGTTEIGTKAWREKAEWIKIAAAKDESKDPKEWTPSEETFVNHYGNHKGKYVLTVDFSTGVMNGMHIKDDKHLQKALKYYIASGKTEDVVLNLDQASATDNTFKISKISIALIQTIQAAGKDVKVQACTTHGTPKIIVTQDGQAELGLATKTEVPALNKVFNAATDVFLASNTNWTWSDSDPLPIDNKVKSITNEGTITVDAENIQLSEAGVMIYNAKDATMNITKVTTVKNTLHNYGKINVGSKSITTAELRAYGARIYNNASELDQYGVIDNYGVVGSTSGTSGEFHNWGLINMMNDDAMTLLKSNEKGTKPFGKAFNASSNKMGTVVLPENNPYAIVSVNNEAENGFIKYNWTGDTYTTPVGNVKYNTIVVSDDIAFSGAATEVQYIEFNGTRTQVVSPAGALTGLKGIMVDNENHNASIIIEKTNQIDCKIGAYLGDGATVYKGGTFTLDGGVFGPGTVTNYLGSWSTDQIVVWGE